MGVPKQRHTKSRRNKRRMHIFLEEPKTTVCQRCGKPVFPHTVCQYCGYYKGREVLDILKKLTKKERKKRERAMKAAQEEKQKERPLSWEELSQR